MVLTEEEQQAGFDLRAVDLLVYLRRKKEIVAAFPVGVAPQTIHETVQLAGVEVSSSSPSRGIKPEVQASEETAKIGELKGKGLFVAFEGGDGAGKQTQARALWQRLRRMGYPVVLAEEPGSTLLGRVLRSWLTAPQANLPRDVSAKAIESLLADETIGDAALPHIMLRSAAPRAELLLFVLARAQLVEEVLQPRLSEGSIIICSRYAPSTVAYQGYGQGLGLDLVREANRIATQGLEPDVVFLLDLSPEHGLARKMKERDTGGRDHFEDKELAFHQRVRQGYLEMAAADPERWMVMDATLPRAKIRKIVWDRVAQLLGKENSLKNS